MSCLNYVKEGVLSWVKMEIHNVHAVELGAKDLLGRMVKFIVRIAIIRFGVNIRGIKLCHSDL